MENTDLPADYKARLEALNEALRLAHAAARIIREKYGEDTPLVFHGPEGKVIL